MLSFVRFPALEGVHLMCRGRNRKLFERSLPMKFSRAPLPEAEVSPNDFVDPSLLHILPCPQPSLVCCYGLTKPGADLARPRHVYCRIGHHRKRPSVVIRSSIKAKTATVLDFVP